MNQKEIQFGQNTKFNQEGTQKCDKIKGVQIISKTQINTWFKIPNEIKSNQHIIDEIPIGKRYQMRIRYQNESKIPIKQIIKERGIKLPKESKRF